MRNLLVHKIKILKVGLLYYTQNYNPLQHTIYIYHYYFTEHNSNVSSQSWIIYQPVRDKVYKTKHMNPMSVDEMSSDLKSQKAE